MRRDGSFQIHAPVLLGVCWGGLIIWGKKRHLLWGGRKDAGFDRACKQNLNPRISMSDLGLKEEELRVPNDIHVRVVCLGRVLLTILQ